MYYAKFINSKGDIFNFGYRDGNIFDIDGLTGHDMNVAFSQGFNQIGGTVERISVGSHIFEIKGKLLNQIVTQKEKMLSVFAPFESGKLVFEDKYFLDCVVYKTPIIAVGEKNPKFEMVLCAPYPFWQKITANNLIVGSYEPAFSFPVNYGEPHVFGIKNPNAFINAYNDGQIDTYYRLEFRTQTTTVNPSIINVNTQEFLKLNTTIYQGEKFVIYRNSGRLLVEKENDGIITDVFSLLDEDSDLLFMHVGDNIIRAFADEGEDQLITTITFNSAVVGVYESI